MALKKGTADSDVRLDPINKKKSLSRKLGRSVLKLTIALALFSMVAGGCFYLIPAVQNYSSQVSDQLLETATYIASMDGSWDLVHDSVKAYDALEDNYDASSKEQKKEEWEDYNDTFAKIAKTDTYKQIYEMCMRMTEDGELEDVYLAGYDRENNKLLYICDPKEGVLGGHRPGQLKTVLFRKIIMQESAEEESNDYDVIGTVFRTKEDGVLFTGGMPIVLFEDSNMPVYIMGTVSTTSMVRSVTRLLLYYFLLLLIIVIIILLLMKLRLRKLLVTPLGRITEAAQSYSEDKQNNVAVTDHFNHLKLNEGDEIDRLRQIMSHMETGLIQYEEDLTKVTAEKERISTELALASKIQATMLPSSFPAFPERKEFDVYATMTPAKEVGGDFYDFFMVDEDHLALVIADVAGKGVPAALFMMASKIVISSTTTSDRKPSEVLRMANDSICGNKHEDMFVTVWLGILEISTGHLIAANAGHEKPVLIHADGNAELLQDKHGFVIGGMEGMVYKDYELQLQPGDQIFVYTDGVPEATSEAEGLFGTDRMVEAIQKAPKENPEQILQAVQEAVDTFVGEDEQFDDLTMLCVKIRETTGETAEKQGDDTAPAEM